jgi:hypothetical protein
MQWKHMNTLDAGRRVQAFLDTESASLGNPVIPELRATLDREVEQLDAFQLELGDTTDSALGTTAVLKAIRQELYDRYMVPITRIAKRVMRGSPDLVKLVVPSAALTSGRVGDFLTKADNMVKAVEKNVDALQAGGFLPSELPKFKEAIARFDALEKERTEHLGRRNASASGSGEVAAELRETVKVIDGVLRAPLQSNRALRDRWRIAKSIKKTPVTPNATGNDGADAPSTTSSTTPNAPATPPSQPVTGDKAA